MPRRNSTFEEFVISSSQEYTELTDTREAFSEPMLRMSNRGLSKDSQGFYAFSILGLTERFYVALPEVKVFLPLSFHDGVVMGDVCICVVHTVVHIWISEHSKPRCSHSASSISSVLQAWGFVLTLVIELLMHSTSIRFLAFGELDRFLDRNKHFTSIRD